MYLGKPEGIHLECMPLLLHPIHLWAVIKEFTYYQYFCSNFILVILVFVLLTNLKVAGSRPMR
jgi:hypothetical protein